jgi:hypothetical protein
MEISTPQAIKVAIISLTGLSRDALHIYGGLAIFILVAAFGKKLRIYLAWLTALTVALAVEASDAHDDLAWFGHWRWQESLHDVINTLFWPSVLMGLWIIRSRYGRAKG